MAYCEIHRDVSIIGQDSDLPDFKWHYARSVFDWSVPAFELAYSCAWDGPWDIKERPDLGAVYVITSDAGNFCKIGISNAPWKRIWSMQTGHWEDLKLFSVLWVWDGAARLVEKTCHAEARKRGLEVRREWIRCTPYGALDMILSVAARLDVQASGNEGVRLTLSDSAACRAHAELTASRDRLIQSGPSLNLGFATSKLFK